MNYGEPQVWGTSSKTNLDRIMKLQKKAVRIMSNSGHLCHAVPIFKNFNLFNQCM